MMIGQFYLQKKWRPRKFKYGESLTLIPSEYYVVARNHDWKTRKSLLKFTQVGMSFNDNTKVLYLGTMSTQLGDIRILFLKLIRI